MSRPRTWKRLAALVALALMVCPGTALAAPQAQIELWTISLRPLLTSYVQGMLGRYERAHPGLRVRWVDLELEAFDQKLLAAIAGGVSGVQLMEAAGRAVAQAAMRRWSPRPKGSGG